MNKLWAIIDLCENETAQNILSALFSKEDFNSQNAILIEEQIVFVEVFFEGIPPQNIVEAIGGYSRIRCGYGEVSKEVLKRGGKLTEQVSYTEEQGTKLNSDSTKQKSDNLEEGEVSVTVEKENVKEEAKNLETEGEKSSEEKITPEPEQIEISEGNEVPTQQESVGDEADKISEQQEVERNGANENPAQPKEEKSAPKPKKDRKSREVPERIEVIDEIACKATSFENFVEEVSKWLELGKWGAFFKSLVETATVLEKVSWKTLEENTAFQLDTKFKHGQIQLTVCASKKFKKNGQDATILVLIKYMMKYKEFDFCINIEKKVKDILNEMGLEKEPTQIKKMVLDVANTAVRNEFINRTLIELCIFAGHGADEKEACDTRMIFSNFINGFFEKNNMEMMPAEVFIKKLREAIYTGARIW